MSQKKLFCQRGPLAYALSLNKQILTRKLRDAFSRERFARQRCAETCSGLLWN